MHKVSKSVIAHCTLEKKIIHTARMFKRSLHTHIAYISGKTLPLSLKASTFNTNYSLIDVSGPIEWPALIICKNPIYKAQDKYETLMRLKDDALIPLEDVFYSAEDIVNTISVAKTYEAGRVIDTRYVLQILIFETTV